MGSSDRVEDTTPPLFLTSMEDAAAEEDGREVLYNPPSGGEAGEVAFVSAMLVLRRWTDDGTFILRVR
jgi:hypothetical protein